MNGWYKRDPSKFIGGVVGLGPDVIGAYAIIIDLIYQHDGPIIDDAAWIGGILGCSSRKAKSLIDCLVDAGKLQRNDGKIRNERADEVIVSRSNLSRERAEHGAKGGRNIRETSVKQSRTTRETSVKQSRSDDEIEYVSSKINELDEAKLSLDRERDRKKEREERKTGDTEKGFDDFYMAYPRKVGKGHAERAYRTACKKIKPEKLLEAVKIFSASQSGKDPKYIPHPATWLNGERWADDDPPTHGEPDQRPKYGDIAKRYATS